MSLLPDTWALTRRWLIHLRRDSMSLTLGALQPLLLLLLVGPLLNHVVNNADELRSLLRQRFHTDDYLTFMFSGVAAFTILLNSVLGGIPIVFDRETGFMDKILVAPVSRLAIVAARFIYVVVYSLLQVGLISVVALLIGLDTSHLLAGLACLVGFGALLAAGLTAISLTLAFLFPHHSIFFAIAGFLLSPLLVLSPTFVAREVMPPWMAAAAAANPLTHAIEPIRGAFLGTPTDLLGSALWLLVFDAACFALAARVISRRLD